MLQRLLHLIIIIPSSTAALIRFAGLNVSIFSIKSAASSGTALDRHCKNGRSSTRFRLTNSRTSAFSIISKSYSHQKPSFQPPPTACRRSGGSDPSVCPRSAPGNHRNPRESPGKWRIRGAFRPTPRRRTKYPPYSCTSDQNPITPSTSFSTSSSGGR